MKQILAAIKDKGATSADVVKTASRICKVENAGLFIVYVYEVPFSLPLDEVPDKELEKGDDILDWAVEIADTFDIQVETHIIQSRTAGSGILNETRDLEVEYAVIGTGEKSTDSENLFGDTVKYLEKIAKCGLIIVKPPHI